MKRAITGITQRHIEGRSSRICIRTTPAFLAAVRPKVALISVGRHNLFGHPAPSTIARLQLFGAVVYRTDENGAIAVATDGNTYSVTPMLGNDDDAGRKIQLRE